MKRGLIGLNINYSFSKGIHESFNNKEYNIYNIDEKDLKDFILKKDYDGLNVTIPYKEKVIEFLDELDKSAKEIGVVNTIINRNNKLIGYNTDVYGFNKLLDFYNIDVSNKNVLILGTGATSKTVEYCLNKRCVKSILKVSRDAELNYNSIYNKEEVLNNTDIVINATPVGTCNNLGLLVDLKRFLKVSCVIDVIYNPHKTELLESAKKLGIKYYNGLVMLVYQASESCGLMDFKKYQLKDINKVYLNTLFNHTNLVLIGMPGVGKSTIGKELSKIFRLDYIDLDDEYKKEYGLYPSDEIIKNGEEEFRIKESKLVNKFEFPFHSIISTGGGIIEVNDNYKRFKDNSIIIYLKRKPSSFTLNKNRPLTSNLDEWNLRFNERKKLYESWADMEIECDRYPQETINLLVGKIKEL